MPLLGGQSGNEHAIMIFSMKLHLSASDLAK